MYIVTVPDMPEKSQAIQCDVYCRTQMIYHGIKYLNYLCAEVHGPRVTTLAVNYCEINSS